MITATIEKISWREMSYQTRALCSVTGKVKHAIHLPLIFGSADRDITLLSGSLSNPRQPDRVKLPSSTALTGSQRDEHSALVESAAPKENKDPIKAIKNVLLHLM